MMELDLDSILNSHAHSVSDDSDDDDSFLPHRTVDEILLNHSSASPSPPSSPRRHEQSEGSSVSSEALKLTHSQSQLLSSELKPSGSSSVVVSRIKSDDLSSPFLYGVIRSNAKPGAALAAAAAASRSFPTPHASAIRRASSASISTVRKASSAASDSVVASPRSAVDVEVDGLLASEGISNSEINRAIVLDSLHSDSSTLELPVVDIAQENLSETSRTFAKLDAVNGDDIVSNVDNVPVEISIHSPIRTESSFEVDGNSVQSELLERKNDHIEHLPANEDDTLYAETRASVEETLPSSVSGCEVSSVKEITPMVSEMMEEENVVLESQNHEFLSGGEDNSSESGVADILEQQVIVEESERGSLQTEKKPPPPLKPIELAEEHEKNQTFAGMHWEEGAAAQPMRLEGVRTGSIALGYFDINAENTLTHNFSSPTFRQDHGSPQVLTVHSNYIAVGMSKGMVVVMPSKYTPQRVDDMNAKMVMLSLHGERAHIPVTSLCFNYQGDLLFAGYGDGQYTVWDVQRASAAKVVTEHKAPVVHLFFLGQDSRQFNVVSGDSKGIVKLIRFSIVPWLNRISYSKSMKLLDETTSTVVCASPLLSVDSLGSALTPSLDSSTASSGSVGSMMGSMVGGDTGWKLFDGSSLGEEGVVVFVTHQSALVAKVSPSVEVYAQLPRPNGVREGSMPYAAWKCMPGVHNSSNENVPDESSHKVSLLAIAWDQKVQVAKLVKSELKVVWEWTLDSSAVGVAWLDDQMLVILMSTGQLCLFEKDGNMIHQTSFSTDGSREDDIISYHTYFSSAHGNPEKAHHNCIAVRGANVYLLGSSQLVISRLLPWKERIEVLRKAGDWMGALNMAMTLYDGQTHGVIDLPRSLSDIQQAIMPYLVELLLAYVEEVFSYISVASRSHSGKLSQSDESNDRNHLINPEIKEQYVRVGGVAVEFCLHIKRTDILFDEIWKKFDNEKQQDTFLELLEPYILKDMLGSLPPEIMQVLVEHYSNKGWLQRVEQCVLHMDISSLDFNQVVRICREHMLYGALIYLFNKGLGDFKAPLEELFAIIRNNKGETSAPFGYKMLVYLKYCFQGLAFPPGHGTIPAEILPSLRKELVQFLLEDYRESNSLTTKSLSADEPYPNLLYLLQLDTEATLDILQYAFAEDGPQLNHIPADSTNSYTESAEVNGLSEGQNLVQELVDVLAAILDARFFQSGDDDRSIDTWPSKREINHILDFIAYYVSCERAKVSKGTLSQILEYLTSEPYSSYSASEGDETLKKRQKQLVTLLEALPEHEWDAPYLLHLCERAQFHQVCGLIHSVRHQYLSALDSYIKVVDEPIYAFSFIHDMLQLLGNKESDAFQSAVISRIPDLVKLSREGTFFMVVSYFGEKFEHILSELHSHPKSLFLYLKTLIEVQSSGTLNFTSIINDNVLEFPHRRKGHQSQKIHTYLETLSKFPKVVQNYPVHVTDEMTELYLELLCQYEHNSVRNFLESLESYRVEHCLRLCLEHGITDAAAFLFERVGDVGSALSLLLSSLNDKFILLDAYIEKELCRARLKHFNNVLDTKEVNDILEMVNSCISLCQRNSPRLDPYESECLWFELLDSFCEPLMDSFNDKVEDERDKTVGISTNSMGNLKDVGAGRIKWKVSKSRRNAEVLRRLLSYFIKVIVEGMIGYVRLPTVMLKLLSENGSQEFGDFKLTIMGMLGIYDFERRILDTAKSLIEDDTYYTMSLLKRGASHGYAPRGLTCCVCNCPLSRSSSSIQIFNCGHATHLPCELPDNSTSSNGSSAGCPICMPRNNSKSCRSKSTLTENGLVSKSSKPHQVRTTNSSHLHDNDALDVSFGLHPVSRFELLSNLEKDQRPAHIAQVPKLRLAPPALYHEKVNKRIEFQAGETSSKPEKPSRSRRLSDIKVKGSAIRFPLKTNIFGKEKVSKY